MPAARAAAWQPRILLARLARQPRPTAGCGEREGTAALLRSVERRQTPGPVNCPSPGRSLSRRAAANRHQRGPRQPMPASPLWVRPAPGGHFQGRAKPRARIPSFAAAECARQVEARLGAVAPRAQLPARSKTAAGRPRSRSWRRRPEVTAQQRPVPAPWMAASRRRQAGGPRRQAWPKRCLRGALSSAVENRAASGWPEEPQRRLTHPTPVESAAAGQSSRPPGQRWRPTQIGLPEPAVAARAM